MLPPEALQHTITIEPYLGTDSNGQPRYGAGVSVTGFVEHGRKLVRGPGNASGIGDQVLSEATAYVPLGTSAPPESRVTLHNGHVTFVINCIDNDGGNLPVPSHTEIVMA